MPSTQTNTLRAAAVRVDELKPDVYWVPLSVADEAIGQLRDALVWALSAYKDAIAGKPTSAADVISHAEKALRDAD